MTHRKIGIVLIADVVILAALSITGGLILRDQDFPPLGSFEELLKNAGDEPLTVGDTAQLKLAMEWQTNLLKSSRIQARRGKLLFQCAFGILVFNVLFMALVYITSLGNKKQDEPEKPPVPAEQGDASNTPN